MPHDMDSDLNADLQEIYEVNKFKGLEVVLLALGYDELLFEESFSQLPWLAIPHEDQASRDRLCSHFVNRPQLVSPRAVLLDPYGNIVLRNCASRFRALGPQGFPFTEDVMDKLSYEDDLFWYNFVRNRQRISLIEILGKTIISSEGDEASLNYLFVLVLTYLLVVFH